MPKYYVDSGNLKFTVDATDEWAALLAAFVEGQHDYDLVLGSVVRVNERGFELDHPDDVYYSTAQLLTELGM